MPFYQVLETERLILRMPKKRDYIYQYNFQKDPLNFPLADHQIYESIEDVELHFDQILKQQKNHECLFWILEDKSTKVPVGTLSAWNIDIDKNSIEFGYNLYPESRGKGFMSEAIRVATKYLHYELGFTIFNIWTDKNNIPSIKLAKKLGFRFMGYVDEKAHYSDKIISYATYQLKFISGQEKKHE